MPKGLIKSVNQCFADPLVLLKLMRTARRRQRQQPDAVGQAPQVRLVSRDGTMIEFGCECHSGIKRSLRGPGGAVRQLRAQLMDLCDQSLRDMLGSVGAQHGVAQKAW
ncbi:hypothetical protein NK6_839 [Bradyrhizobium diazoefficiens]|uniref:Uncharacterized protein n=1 Tax=Bradyrhizobium diazoefficiens TaxID=1355477 RepID=A0A0E4FV15_9BRAD|nr:hypothetical protein NK6_839 [Bradyrhizobium diazoefficiens]